MEQPNELIRFFGSEERVKELLVLSIADLLDKIENIAKERDRIYHPVNQITALEELSRKCLDNLKLLQSLDPKGVNVEQIAYKRKKG